MANSFLQRNLFQRKVNRHNDFLKTNQLEARPEKDRMKVLAKKLKASPEF